MCASLADLGSFLQHRHVQSSYAPSAVYAVSGVLRCATLCVVQDGYCAAFQIEVMTSSISCQLLTPGDDHASSTVSIPNVNLYINQIPDNTPYYVNW